MDEVRTDRLVWKYGSDTLLVIIRDWPVSEKYKDKPDLVASLEYLVCVAAVQRLNFIAGLTLLKVDFLKVHFCGSAVLMMRYINQIMSEIQWPTF